jgi:hypothetical protein
MSYSIRNLAEFINGKLDSDLKNEKTYLFDANVWLYILDPPPNENKDYCIFFDKLKENNRKIVLPLFLFSEVINRFLYNRCHKFNESYKRNRQRRELPIKNIPFNQFFKQKYRKSRDFQFDFAAIRNNFTTAVPFCEIISSNSIEEKHYNRIEKLFDFPNMDIDFSDYFYYLIAKHNNYVIVTHDSDFLLENVEIITLNSKLIDHANNAD